jgi:hypothetical protein
MDALTKLSPQFLFRLSVWAAGFLFVVAAYIAVAVWLIEAAPTGRFSLIQPPALVSTVSAIVAIGSLALMRHRIYGLLLVLLFPVAFGFFSSWLLTGAYVVLALAVLGTPYLLVALHAHSNRVAG